MDPRNARGRNRPRHRLASFGPDGTSLTQLTYYLQCVGEATLIGAEGDCALVGGIIRKPWFPLFRNVNKNIKIVHKYLLFAWNKMTY